MRDIGVFWNGSSRTILDRNSQGNTLRQNIIAYYKFNDNISDYSGNNNTLTTLNTVSYSTNALEGKSIYSGTEIFCNLSLTDFYLARTPVSISVWVLPPQVFQSSSDVAGIIGLYGAFNIRLPYTSGGYAFEYKIGTKLSWSGQVESRNDYILGKWNHLVLTWDTRILRKYINGNILQTVHYTSSDIGTANYSNDVIDIEMPTSNIYFIDELAIWQKCLNPGEIKYIHDRNSVGLSLI